MKIWPGCGRDEEPEEKVILFDKETARRPLPGVRGHTPHIDAALRTEVYAMTVLKDAPDIGRTNAALLVEKLAEIYSTPTPKGWHKARKVIVLID